MAPPDRHGFTTTDAPGVSGNCTAPSGRTRNSTLSLVASAPQGGRAHRILRALTADETLDRAVLQEDRLVAGMTGRGRLRPHHGRMDERPAIARQLRRTLFQIHRASSQPTGDIQIGGVSRGPAWPPTPGTGGERHVGVPDTERASASTTAFTTAAGDPTVADSPMPFAPSRVVRRRGHGETGLELRNLERGGDQVIHQ